MTCARVHAQAHHAAGAVQGHVAPALTFADLSDVEVEPSDGEQGVLDLQRHRL
jgi:hypothetical protein